MKTYLIVLLASVAFSAVGQAQTLFESDFEGADFAANNISQDRATLETTSSAFGSSNQYADLNDGSSVPNRGNVFSNAINIGTSAVYTGFLDFNEPDQGSRNDPLQIGFANDDDMQSSTRIAFFLIDDGALTFGSNNTTYTLGSSYSIALSVNTTGSDVVDYFQGQTLNAGEVDLWIKDFGATDWTFVGSDTVITSTLAANQHFGVGTASNAWQQRVLVDNYKVTSGTLVPEPSAFALICGLLGFAWVAIRRRV